MSEYCITARVVKCPTLYDPDYGNVHVSGDYREGAIATYSCQEHYRISGPVTRRCEKGIWIGVVPTCIRKGFSFIWMSQKIYANFIRYRTYMPQS